MSTSLFRNAVITFATGSSALIFCSYMYQDGFFSSFGIRIERYLDGLPEPIMLSMPMIEVIVILGILGFIGVFYCLYCIKEEKPNEKIIDHKKPPVGKLVTIGVIALTMFATEVAEYFHPWLALYITVLQTVLSLAITVIFVLIIKEHQDEFLYQRRYAAFLKSWFPVAVVFAVFLLLGGSLKWLGRYEATVARRNKTHVTLLKDERRIELDSGTYYIRHTKQWVFFYNETEGNIIYPISKVSSIRFKGRQQRPI